MFRIPYVAFRWIGLQWSEQKSQPKELNNRIGRKKYLKELNSARWRTKKNRKSLESTAKPLPPFFEGKMYFVNPIKACLCARVCVCVTWRAICSETVTLCSIFTLSYYSKKKTLRSPHTPHHSKRSEKPPTLNWKKNNYFLCATKIEINTKESTETKKNHNH